MRKNVGNFNRNFAFESKLFSFLLMQDGNSNQEDDKGSGHLPGGAETKAAEAQRYEIMRSDLTLVLEC